MHWIGLGVHGKGGVYRTPTDYEEGWIDFLYRWVPCEPYWLLTTMRIGWVFRIIFYIPGLSVGRPTLVKQQNSNVFYLVNKLASLCGRDEFVESVRFILVFRCQRMEFFYIQILANLSSIVISASCWCKGSIISQRRMKIIPQSLWPWFLKFQSL